MNKSHYNDNEHLTNEDMRLLKQNALSIEDSIKALTHVSMCDICAAAFSECFDEQELLTASPDFSSVAQRKALDIQEEPINQKKSEKKKKEFYFYVARVSLAMCLTIMILFSGTFNEVAKTFDADLMNKIDFSGINTVSENIRTLSDKIVQQEVVNNDQKKK